MLAVSFFIYVRFAKREDLQADSESAGEAAFFVSVYNLMLFVAFSSVRSLAL